MSCEKFFVFRTFSQEFEPFDQFVADIDSEGDCKGRWCPVVYVTCYCEMCASRIASLFSTFIYIINNFTEYFFAPDTEDEILNKMSHFCLFLPSQGYKLVRRERERHSGCCNMVISTTRQEHTGLRRIEVEMERELSCRQWEWFVQRLLGWYEPCRR